jgi:hypothetical protein
MKNIVVAALAVISLSACSGGGTPAVPPTLEEQGIEKVCTPADPTTGTPEVCVCKTATEATTCP